MTDIDFESYNALAEKDENNPLTDPAFTETPTQILGGFFSPQSFKAGEWVITPHPTGPEDAPFFIPESMDPGQRASFQKRVLGESVPRVALDENNQARPTTFTRDGVSVHPVIEQGPFTTESQTLKAGRTAKRTVEQSLMSPERSWMWFFGGHNDLHTAQAEAFMRGKADMMYDPRLGLTPDEFIKQNHAGFWGAIYEEYLTTNSDERWDSFEEEVSKVDPKFTPIVAAKLAEDYLNANPRLGMWLQANGIDLVGEVIHAKNALGWTHNVHRTITSAREMQRAQVYASEVGVMQNLWESVKDSFVYDSSMAFDLAMNVALFAAPGTAAFAGARLAHRFAAMNIMGKTATAVTRIKGGPLTGPVEGLVFYGTRALVGGEKIANSWPGSVALRMGAIGVDGGVQAALYDLKNQNELIEYNTLTGAGPLLEQDGIDFERLAAATGIGTGASMAFYTSLRAAFFGAGMGIRGMYGGDVLTPGWGKMLAGAEDTFAVTETGQLVWGARYGRGAGVLFGDSVDRYLSKNNKSFSLESTGPEFGPLKARTGITVQSENADDHFLNGARQLEAKLKTLIGPAAVVDARLINPERMKASGLSFGDLSKLLDNMEPSLKRLEAEFKEAQIKERAGLSKSELAARPALDNDYFRNWKKAFLGNAIEQRQIEAFASKFGVDASDLTKETTKALGVAYNPALPGHHQMRLRTAFDMVAEKDLDSFRTHGLNNPQLMKKVIERNGVPSTVEGVKSEWSVKSENSDAVMTFFLRDDGTIVTQGSIVRSSKRMSEQGKLEDHEETIFATDGSGDLSKITSSGIRSDVKTGFAEGTMLINQEIRHLNAEGVRKRALLRELEEKESLTRETEFEAAKTEGLRNASTILKTVQISSLSDEALKSEIAKLAKAYEQLNATAGELGFDAETVVQASSISAQLRALGREAASRVAKFFDEGLASAVPKTRVRVNKSRFGARSKSLDSQAKDTGPSKVPSDPESEVESLVKELDDMESQSLRIREMLEETPLRRTSGGDDLAPELVPLLRRVAHLFVPGDGDTSHWAAGTVRGSIGLRESGFVRVDGTVPKKGFAVEIDGRRFSGEDIKAHEIEKFMIDNKELLSRPDAHMRFTTDEKGNKTVSVVRIVDQRGVADKLAARFNSPEVHRLRDPQTFETGATGPLRNIDEEISGVLDRETRIPVSEQSHANFVRAIKANTNPLSVKAMQDDFKLSLEEAQIMELLIRMTGYDMKALGPSVRTIAMPDEWAELHDGLGFLRMHELEELFQDLNGTQPHSKAISQFTTPEWLSEVRVERRSLPAGTKEWFDAEWRKINTSGLTRSEIELEGRVGLVGKVWIAREMSVHPEKIDYISGKWDQNSAGAFKVVFTIDDDPHWAYRFYWSDRHSANMIEADWVKGKDSMLIPRMETVGIRLDRVEVGRPLTSILLRKISEVDPDLLPAIKTSHQSNPLFAATDDTRLIINPDYFVAHNVLILERGGKYYTVLSDLGAQSGLSHLERLLEQHKDLTPTPLPDRYKQYYDLEKTLDPQELKKLDRANFEGRQGFVHGVGPRASAIVRADEDQLIRGRVQIMKDIEAFLDNKLDAPVLVNSIRRRLSLMRQIRDRGDAIALRKMFRAELKFLAVAESDITALDFGDYRLTIRDLIKERAERLHNDIKRVQAAGLKDVENAEAGGLQDNIRTNADNLLIVADQARRGEAVLEEAAIFAEELRRLLFAARRIANKRGHGLVADPAEFRADLNEIDQLAERLNTLERQAAQPPTQEQIDGALAPAISTIQKLVERAKERGGIFEIQEDPLLTSAGVHSRVIDGNDNIQHTLRQGVDDNRGSITFLQIRESAFALIRANHEFDVSTMTHEWAHFLEKSLLSDTALAMRSLQLDETDVLAFYKWANVRVESGKAVWSRASSEKFAVGFEKFIRDDAAGVVADAPKPYLQAIFERLGKWIATIYEESKTLDAVEITPAARKVYERLATRYTGDEIGEIEVDTLARRIAGYDAESKEAVADGLVGDMVISNKKAADEVGLTSDEEASLLRAIGAEQDAEAAKAVALEKKIQATDDSRLGILSDLEDAGKLSPEEKSELALLRTSAVQPDEDFSEPIEVFHGGTLDSSEARGGSALLFVGSEAAATHAIRGTKGKVIPGSITSSNPIEMVDSKRAHTPSTIAEDIESKNPGLIPHLAEAITKIEKTEGVDAASEALVTSLKNKGYDSIKFQNENEDAGSTSYIVFGTEAFKTGKAAIFDVTPEWSAKIQEWAEAEYEDAIDIITAKFGDRVDPVDIVGDIFLDMQRGRVNLAEIENPQAFIRSRAKLRAISATRAGRLAKTKVLETGGVDEGEARGVLDATLDKDERLPNKNAVDADLDARATVFSKILADIDNPETATMLRMKYIKDMSNKEIAEKLGKKPDTVRRTLNRAMTKLRKDLNADDFGIETLEQSKLTPQQQKQIKSLEQIMAKAFQESESPGGMFRKLGFSTEEIRLLQKQSEETFPIGEPQASSVDFDMETLNQSARLAETPEDFMAISGNHRLFERKIIAPLIRDEVLNEGQAKIMRTLFAASDAEAFRKVDAKGVGKKRMLKEGERFKAGEAFVIPTGAGRRFDIHIDRATVRAKEGPIPTLIHELAHVADETFPRNDPEIRMFWLEMGRLESIGLLDRFVSRRFNIPESSKDLIEYYKQPAEFFAEYFTTSLIARRLDNDVLDSVMPSVARFARETTARLRVLFQHDSETIRTLDTLSDIIGGFEREIPLTKKGTIRKAGLTENEEFLRKRQQDQAAFSMETFGQARISKDDKLRAELLTTKGRAHADRKALAKAIKDGVTGTALDKIRLKAKSSAGKVLALRKALQARGAAEKFSDAELSISRREVRGISTLDDPEIHAEASIKMVRSIENRLLKTKDKTERMFLTREFAMLSDDIPAARRIESDVNRLLSGGAEKWTDMDPDNRRTFELHVYNTLTQDHEAAQDAHNVLVKALRMTGIKVPLERLGKLVSSNVAFGDTAMSSIPAIAEIAKFFSPQHGMLRRELSSSLSPLTFDAVTSESFGKITGHGIRKSIDALKDATKSSGKDYAAVNKAVFQYVLNPEAMPSDVPHRKLVQQLATNVRRWNEDWKNEMVRTGNLSPERAAQSSDYGFMHVTSGEAHQRFPEFIKALTSNQTRKWEASEGMSLATLEGLGWVKIKVDDDDGIAGFVIPKDSPLAEYFPEDKIGVILAKSEMKDFKFRQLGGDGNTIKYHIDEATAVRYLKALRTMTDDYLPGWKAVFASRGGVTGIERSMIVAAHRLNKMADPFAKDFDAGSRFHYTDWDPNYQRILSHQEVVEDPDLLPFFETNAEALIKEFTHRRGVDILATKALTQRFGKIISMDQFFKLVSDMVETQNELTAKQRLSLNKALSRYQTVWAHQIGRPNFTEAGAGAVVEWVGKNARDIAMADAGIRVAFYGMASELPKALFKSDLGKPVIFQFVPNFLNMIKFAANRKGRVDMIEMGDALKTVRAMSNDMFSHRLGGDPTEVDALASNSGHRSGLGQVLDTWKAVWKGELDARGEKVGLGTRVLRGFSRPQGILVRWQSEVIEAMHVYQATKTFTQDLDKMLAMGQGIDKLDGGWKEFKKLAYSVGLSPEEAREMSSAGLFHPDMALIKRASQEADVLTHGHMDLNKLRRWAYAQDVDVRERTEGAIGRMGAFIGMTQRNINREPTLMDLRVANNPFAQVIKVFTQFVMSSSLQLWSKAGRAGNIELLRTLLGLWLAEQVGVKLWQVFRDPTKDIDEHIDEVRLNPAAHILPMMGRLPITGMYGWMINAASAVYFMSRRYGAGDLTVPESATYINAPSVLGNIPGNIAQRLTRDTNRFLETYVRSMGGYTSDVERVEMMRQSPLFPHALSVWAYHTADDPEFVNRVENANADRRSNLRIPKTGISDQIGAPVLGRTPPNPRDLKIPGASGRLADALE